MSTIKETILHPDGNEGVDLYPKTNINQVQELPQKLTSVENQISQLNIGKLTKPTNPSAESAVTMLADGTVGTKLLSEIGGGGGGKLYLHKISANLTTEQATINIDIINNGNSPMSENEYFRAYLVENIVASFNGSNGAGAVTIRYIIGTDNYIIVGAVANTVNTGTGYYLNITDAFNSFNDVVTEL